MKPLEIKWPRISGAYEMDWLRGLRVLGYWLTGRRTLIITTEEEEDYYYYENPPPVITIETAAS